MSEVEINDIRKLRKTESIMWLRICEYTKSLPPRTRFSVDGLYMFIFESTGGRINPDLIMPEILEIFNQILELGDE